MNRYGAVVWRAGQTPVRHRFDHPLDALAAAVGYLRDGYNVRLTDATCAALTTSDYAASMGTAARTARLAALFTPDPEGPQ